jgi:hypothetical protein
MIRSAASKVMWVGRTASMVFGLALVMALVIGVASTAWSATGGNFLLGKANVATTASKLTASVAAPALTLVNQSTDAAATALNISVAAGKPPLKVNATAGKATNLDADKLDGKDATAFYAAGSKVDDSDTLDGQDSAAFLGATQKAADSDTLDGKNSTEFLGKTEKAADSELLDGKNSSEFAAAYMRTVVVSPVGTDTQNGTALLNALSSITDASATKKYLLYIEPGTYDLGTNSLQMKQYVDIHGAGELNTLITSSVQIGCMDGPGTLNGANNAELRFLTVRNTGTTKDRCDIAIWNNNASPRLTHVTAEAVGVGAMDNIGVMNVGRDSSPTMTDVTATASGGTWNYAVFNIGASPTIKQSKLTGSFSSLTQRESFGIDGTGKVALTQLVGPVRNEGGILRCFNNYDQNMAAVTCPS